MLDEDFTHAQKRVEDSYQRMDNETIRKVYAYYKQATEGDISGKRPSVLRIRDRIKFDAWSSISGMSKDEAKVAYIDLVNRLELNAFEVTCDMREQQAITEQSSER
ncbi:MAG: acyl-CoA-binding protein [Euryarchaeota archaeon]|nr:acyl-CoA-binding protein [Euryarchaeota archaeon]DAC50806.1 MAG TPA: acyl-CoA-binding protein [Candidatus Poseidoniales archaeon]HII32320.1 acyl-CoA-binding protein [Candidatus Poseidoniaceae archaeon]|tara:strand:- start:155 stop:472 length:318 start_codon:yes stop_codon:yes gene_type:complete